MSFTSDDIGKRVCYTNRSGGIAYGTIRGIAGKFVDVAIDGMSRPVFYIPDDMLRFTFEDEESALE